MQSSGRFLWATRYWQGDDPFPLKSWLQVTYPLLKAASGINILAGGSCSLDI